MESNTLRAIDFKTEVQQKIWTFRALAARWDATEGYVSRLSKNVKRPLHWDAAVRGLPVLMHLSKKTEPRSKLVSDICGAAFQVNIFSSIPNQTKPS